MFGHASIERDRSCPREVALQHSYWACSVHGPAGSSEVGDEHSAELSGFAVPRGRASGGRQRGRSSVASVSSRNTADCEEDKLDDDDEWTPSSAFRLPGTQGRGIRRRGRPPLSANPSPVPRSGSRTPRLS